MSRRLFFLPFLLLAGCTFQDPAIQSGGGELRVFPPVEPLDALTPRVPMGLISGSGTAVWTRTDENNAIVEGTGNLPTVVNLVLDRKKQLLQAKAVTYTRGNEVVP